MRFGVKDAIILCLILGIVGTTSAINSNDEKIVEPPETEHIDFAYVTEHLKAADEELKGELDENDTGYAITEEEADLISRIVEAEAGNQSYYGMVLVAQCIRNACEIDGLRPAEAIKTFQYAEPKKDPSATAMQAVTDVFLNNFKVTELPILYFYSTSGGFVSEWHESQDYVLTHGSHKFFKRNN